MANCCICGNSPAKIVLSGLDGRICPTCQKNIINIRTGYVDLAKSYFDNLNIQSSSAKMFIEKQYKDYSSVIRHDTEAASSPTSTDQPVNMLISTTSSLDGYRVIKYIDVIYSEVVYKLSLSKSFSVALNNMVDSFKIFSNTELSGTSSLIREAKDYVKQDLIQKAASLGANGIIGIDIESTVGSDGMAKVSINGTAVLIGKID